MTLKSREAGRAAELVRFALQPKVAQGADERYGELCTEFRTDEEFREIVISILEGLGLTFLDQTEQGLIVAPTDRLSPFAYRVSDYKQGLEPKKRMMTGLVHLGIAAACYPTEQDLEDDIVVRRTVEQVETLLRQACAAFAEAEGDDPVVGDGELATAWREFAATPAAKKRKDGGYTADCTMGMITHAFEWLAGQGMARSATPAGTYQVLDRYRVQVRDLGGAAALDRLRDLAAAATAEES